MSKDKMESESEDEYTIASITSLHQSKRQKDMKLSRQNQADILAELKAATDEKESWFRRYEEKSDKLSVLSYKYDLLKKECEKLASQIDSLSSESFKKTNNNFSTYKR